ncbi:SRPBCC family protein [Amycolatopsis acidiphila]|uniref:SRPBCC family protein n=1 Tax=Amycolatopsis acidiphila TaxID=715473 RepID=A0A558AMZ7_9PSEU|nr:SRPBCC family protein [Amycolatopsis acidiphila]TVT25638.1 SRPBCC family protein [Amycolatopsis acidiphila]UIJ60393.1 SRPBCC family protein [Amycolatopsis acidiphila]GHG90427.1 MxaD family protein [Amycolatopsis acidiphila]
MPPKTFSFEVNRTSSASPATLFRLETDGAHWSDWAKPLIVQSSWERWADPVGGIGAIRRVGLFPVLVYEETLEYEQDRRHVYTLARSAPVNDYRAEVTFTPNAAGGTDLRWRGSFTEKIPGSGPVVRQLLRGVITFVSAQLVRAAERD